VPMVCIDLEGFEDDDDVNVGFRPGRYDETSGTGSSGLGADLSVDLAGSTGCGRSPRALQGGDRDGSIGSIGRQRGHRTSPSRAQVDRLLPFVRAVIGPDAAKVTRPRREVRDLV